MDYEKIPAYSSYPSGRTDSYKRKELKNAAATFVQRVMGTLRDAQLLWPAE